MLKCSSSTPVSTEGMRETRERFVQAFDLFLYARGGEPAPHSMDRSKTQSGVGNPIRFELLSEAEFAVREAIACNISERVHVDFIVAILQSIADTTARFGHANRQAASGFYALAVDLLWKGLSELKPAEARNPGNSR